MSRRKWRFPLTSRIDGLPGAVSGFNHGDSLDLGDIAFGSGTGTMLSYSANDAGNVYVGTDLKSVPIVSDGANTAISRSRASIRQPASKARTIKAAALP